MSVDFVLQIVTTLSILFQILLFSDLFFAMIVYYSLLIKIGIFGFVKKKNFDQQLLI